MNKMGKLAKNNFQQLVEKISDIQDQIFESDFEWVMKMIENKKE